MANLKGNLGVKSSPLAPTASKLSTQYLVLDHMTNHYNKISKAKSAIDNKPPKSLSSSQKLRDRKTRHRATSPQRTRPISGNTFAHEQGDLEDYQDLLNEEPEDEEERLAYSIMRSTLGKKTSDSHKATYNSEYPSNGGSWAPVQSTNNYEQTNDFTRRSQTMYERPMSARSGRSFQSATSAHRGTRVPINQVDPAKVTYNGDVIDKRAHCFTEPEKPFTPRTLKTNHQSRLKNSKCYNPPKRAKSVQNGAVQSASHSHMSEEALTGKAQPRPQPRQRIKSAQSEDLGETMPTSQLSESMLMDITLQSRDGRRGQNQKGQVPPLAISMDVDHLNWLQEQASKAKVRARHSGKFKTTLEPQTNGDRQSYTDGDDPHGLSNSVRLETLKKEEEQKYLAFAKEVTDDVLATGISSERVLNKLFENHIERRRGDLDEDRMREVVKDLKKNLGLKEQFSTGTDYKKRTSSRPSSRNSNDDASGKSTPKARSRHSTDNISETSSIKGKLAMTSDINNMLTINGNETLDSTSTMKFGQTGDVFSTIHSEAVHEDVTDLSDGELTMTKKDNGEYGNDLTATQALRQYQMTLTAQEAGGDTNEEVSESEIYNGDQETLDPLESSERPATGEMRTGEGLSTTGQITIETSNNDISTSVSGNNATDISPAPSSEITPGSGTQNSDMSPGYSNNSQESNSYSQLMPQTKPRARSRRRNKEYNTSSSEINGSNNVIKSSNGGTRGLSAVSTGSWSERESENGHEGHRGARLRRATKTEEINKTPLSDNNEEHKIERNSTLGEHKDFDDSQSDYEEESFQEDTHRTSDDDF